MNAKKTPWKAKKTTPFSLSRILGILLILVVFGYYVFLLGTGAIGQKQLEANGIITQAVVINDKNYFGNSPVSHQFFYSFEFIINSKKYTGDTRDPNCRVGDVIRIKYVPANPTFNVKLDSR